MRNEEQSWSKQLNHVRQEAAPVIEARERASLFLKGLFMFPTLVVAASLYWVAMLWDVKNFERRNSHFRLKLHNTWMTYFRPATVARWSGWRQSECAHCGACCEILWRCPFLSTDKDGNSQCTVHIKRPLPCRTFPIDPQSVELISKKRTAERSCSYRFAVLLDRMIEEQKGEVVGNSNVADVSLGEQPPNP